MSGLVSREVKREALNEDQSSVISYFIETAKVYIHVHVCVRQTLQLILMCVDMYMYMCIVCVHMWLQSCRDLKNFAGAFAIMEGLTHTRTQDYESAWKVLFRLLSYSLSLLLPLPLPLVCVCVRHSWCLDTSYASTTSSRVLFPPTTVTIDTSRT